MIYKTIFQGSLRFNSKRSFDKVVDMFRYKIENFFKNDTLVNDEEKHFDEEKLAFIVPRMVVQANKKNWRSTVSLLEYLAQFAVSGQVGGWMVQSGTILKHVMVEPEGDKVAVQSYRKGKDLIDNDQKYEEAIEYLNKAIEKHEAHAEAFELRAYAQDMLGKQDIALADYNTCLEIDPSNPYAYYGRACIYLNMGKTKEAIEDLKLSSAKSIALQPVYWQATRMRGNAYYELKLLDKAAFDLKLFTNRNFQESNPNHKWKKVTQLLYSKVLMELSEYELALESIQKIEMIPGKQEEISEEDYYTILGMAKKMAGKKGYVADLKTAADLGSKKAKSILEEIS